MKVLKRDGRTKAFDKIKISDAILSAAEHHKYNIEYKEVKNITEDIIAQLTKVAKDGVIEVEIIQNHVVSTLKSHKHPLLASKYDEYRKERNKVRENKLKLSSSIEAIGIETDRDNANVGNNFSAKLLRIASEANK
jgi:ribonucleoside-triphosphate reductase